jgi:hypothetical protein
VTALRVGRRTTSSKATRTASWVEVTPSRWLGAPPAGDGGEHYGWLRYVLRSAFQRWSRRYGRDPGNQKRAFGSDVLLGRSITRDRPRPACDRCRAVARVAWTGGVKVERPQRTEDERLDVGVDAVSGCRCEQSPSGVWHQNSGPGGGEVGSSAAEPCLRPVVWAWRVPATAQVGLGHSIWLASSLLSVAARPLVDPAEAI